MKIYANSSISTAINYIFNKLPAEQSRFLECNPLEKDIDTLRYVRVKRFSFIVMHDYYDLRYRKTHPVGGLVITIAGLDYNDRNCDLDYLLNNAVLDARLMNDENSRYLVAEINPDDSYMTKLYKKHNFVLSLELGNKLYYTRDTRL